MLRSVPRIEAATSWVQCAYSDLPEAFAQRAGRPSSSTRTSEVCREKRLALRTSLVATSSKYARV